MASIVYSTLQFSEGMMFGAISRDLARRLAFGFFCALVFSPLLIARVDAACIRTEASKADYIVVSTANSPPPVAVVMGNSAYRHAAPLRNPRNDVEAVRTALASIGFVVFSLVDFTASEADKCIEIALEAGAGATMGLFYYSGHGVQLNGENYLLGLDADADRETDADQLVLSNIIKTFDEHFSTALFFLDACRTNPFGTDLPQGLSSEPARGVIRLTVADPKPFGSAQPSGSFIAYSTSPNAVALDGSGDLSPFTGAFVKSVVVPGLSVQQVMSDVSHLTGEATNWMQKPWSLSSLNVLVKMAGELSLSEAADRSRLAAKRSEQKLAVGDRRTAIVEALEGIPFGVSSDNGDNFGEAAWALKHALRSSATRIRLDDNVSGVFSNSDVTRVATVRQTGNASMSLELWDGVTGNLIGELAQVAGTEGNDMLSVTTFSGDGRFLASMNNTSEVTVWDSENGLPVATISDPTADIARGSSSLTKALATVELSHDGSLLLASGGTTNAFVLWDVAASKQIVSVSKPALSEFIKSHPVGRDRGLKLDAMVGDYGQQLFAYFGDRADKVMFLIQCRCGEYETISGGFDLASMSVNSLILVEDVYDLPHMSSFQMYLGYQPSNVWNSRRDASVHLYFDNRNHRSGLFLFDHRRKIGAVLNSDLDDLATIGISPDGQYVAVSAGSSLEFFDVSTGLPTQGPTLDVNDRTPRGSGVFSLSTGRLLGTDAYKQLSDIWHEPTDFSRIIEEALNLLTPEERNKVAAERARYWLLQ